MITLKEGLLNKKNINNITQPHLTEYKKSDLKSGDVVVFHDKTLAVYIENSNDTFKSIYDWFVKNLGIFLCFYPYDLSNKWQYAPVDEHYDQNLKCSFKNLTVEHVYPRMVPKNLLKNENMLYNWMKDNYSTLTNS